MTICETCGAALSVGDFPFCNGEPSKHAKGANSIEDVTWPGGKVFENLADEPIRCDSPADLKRELKARNLEPFVRHTAGDTHTTPWATMDPYTLAAATALVSRGGKATNDPPPQTLVESLTLTKTVTTDAPIRVRMR